MIDSTNLRSGKSLGFATLTSQAGFTSFFEIRVVGCSRKEKFQSENSLGFGLWLAAEGKKIQNKILRALGCS
jgi:hypothetical protein